MFLLLTMISIGKKIKPVLLLLYSIISSSITVFIIMRISSMPTPTLLSTRQEASGSSYRLQVDGMCRFKFM